MSEHNHPHDHDHEPHDHAPETPMDAGSQALGEALRASFTIVKFAMGALIIVFLASGFFTVGPQERAVILRFGKPVGEGQKAFLGAGLHWSLPYPIDDVQKIPVTESQKVISTVGWFFQTPEMELAGQEPGGTPSLNPATEGYVVTADTNIIHVQAKLSYHIDNPKNYIFSFTSASNVVLNALNNAIVATAARFNVDDILIHNQIGFRDAVRSRATALLEAEEVGVTVENCDVVARPPIYLRSDFENVTAAELARTKRLDDARKDANDTLANATGDASVRIGAAQAERSRLVTSINGFASQFNQLRTNFEQNPDLFMEIVFYPRIGNALSRVQDKIYMPERADGKSRELRLLLNREPPKPNAVQ